MRSFKRLKANAAEGGKPYKEDTVEFKDTIDGLNIVVRLRLSIRYCSTIQHGASREHTWDDHSGVIVWLCLTWFLAFVAKHTYDVVHWGQFGRFGASRRARWRKRRVGSLIAFRCDALPKNCKNADCFRNACVRIRTSPPLPCSYGLLESKISQRL